MNRRKSVTLLISISIHTLIFALTWYLLHKTEEKVLTSSAAKRVELSLQEFVTDPGARALPEKSPPTPAAKASVPSKIKEPKRAEKPKPKPKPKSAEKAETVKKSTEKPVEKERSGEFPTAEKRVPEKIKKSTQPKPQEVPKEKIAAKERRKDEEKTEEMKSSPLSRLAGSLGTPSMPASAPQPPSIADISDALSDREFKALYKDDFDRFTPEQKRFIKDNLSRIQGITQHYLTIRGYPYVAARLGQQGMNIVEFDLHPNGDISGLKVLKGAGFEELDKNSLDTIKTAYKDYPRPRETTKIRFYIYYRLY
ncbi:ferric siderophore transport system, periplasmic binding protein TonB [Hydrogenimonas sp.]|nr:ferric siderophore transport system, periplasmic binding protein TonB [Hydrogenimonas sp.]